jgi:hypothetical protein
MCRPSLKKKLAGFCEASTYCADSRLSNAHPSTPVKDDLSLNISINYTKIFCSSKLKPRCHFDPLTSIKGGR